MPCPAGGKGSVDIAPFCHFVQRQDAAVRALQKLQAKARADSGVNPVRLSSGRCNVANKALSPGDRWRSLPGPGSTPRRGAVLPRELRPMRKHGTRGAGLPSSWRTSLEGEDNPGRKGPPVSL